MKQVNEMCVLQRKKCDVISRRIKSKTSTKFPRWAKKTTLAQANQG
jgi:hypothetical protein